MAIKAAGVVFVESGVSGHYECADCGGLVRAPDGAYGVDPEDHLCSL